MTVADSSMIQTSFPAMPKPSIRLLVATLLAAFLGAGLLPARVAVVSTNTILHDLVQQVGGERVNALCLLEPGVDVHRYEPTPAQVGRLARADLVVSNGFGLETWVNRVIQNSGFKGPVIEAAAGAHLLVLGAGETLCCDDHGHHHHHAGAAAGGCEDCDSCASCGTATAAGIIDPHAWHDIANVARYVENIRRALAALDPDGEAYFNTRAAAFTSRLWELDAWARERLAAIPEAKRSIVISHDALRYLGHAYGIRIRAVRGLSTGQEPDARSLAALLRDLREEPAGAFFVESVSNPRLLEQLSRDTGIPLGGQLYTDSLGKPGSPADSFEGLFRTNIETIVGALL